MAQVPAISPFLQGEGKQRPENPGKLMGQRMQPSIQQKNTTEKPYLKLRQKMKTTPEIIL